MSLSATPIVETSAFTAEIFPPQPNTPVEADDVHAGEQALANRTLYLRSSLLADKIVPHVQVLENYTTPFVIGPPNLFTTSTFTDSAITLDVPGALVGDDLRISVWGTWQLNTASSADVIGQLRANVIENFGGTPVSTPVAGTAVIIGTAPLTLQYVLRVRHRIANAGTARVSIQARILDTSGGAGTGTVIFLFGSRLDVDRTIRS